jgi:hypothetical protein
MRVVKRFGTTWRDVLFNSLVWLILATCGGLVLRLAHAPDGWVVAWLVFLTAIWLYRLILVPGAVITITIRVKPPEQPR